MLRVVTRFLVTEPSHGRPVLLFQLRAPSEPQARLQEAGLPPAEVPQTKGNVPGNSEPQTPVPSSEMALDLRIEGEKGK